LKYLIVNADDFGFTRDVNDGIVHAHRNGILTATTLMATGKAFDHAVALAHQNPSLDVGVHLVLVGAEGYPRTLARLTAAVALGQIKVYDCFRGQVRKILDAGLRPTHLDTHKHTHLLPQVLSAVTRISQEFQIPWVRRLIPTPVPFLQSMGQSMLTRQGCRTTDHFEGFEITGRYDTPALASLIRRLPDGVTEFMCHPGFCRDELKTAQTRLKASRQVELEALTSAEARQAVKESSIALACYRDLA
jgi:chitin disaccharide deacetylase